jgi:DNA polymerase I
MNVVFDIEGNGYNPTKVWLAVFYDLMTGQWHIFRSPTENPEEMERMQTFCRGITKWIGHNVIGYDLPVLEKLCGIPHPDGNSIVDTFICSKLIDYPRPKHSIENYGEEFNFPKGDHTDFTKYSLAMEEYCIRDVQIAARVYRKYKRYLETPAHAGAVIREHRFQIIAERMSRNGFAFNKKAAENLLEEITAKVRELDDEILSAFPPRLKPIREVIPRATKFGTISLSSIPKSLRADIADMVVDAPFSYCQWVVFNPASPKQVVTVLNEAGWRPTHKTDTHEEVERDANKIRRSRKKSPEVASELVLLDNRLQSLRIYGWKINEENLATLPKSAPPAARLLAKRILLESRRRTLTEWVSLCSTSGRIHGKFYGIGAWTHRMGHRNPNTANIPNAVYVHDGSTVPYGKDLRSLWGAPRGRLLVGVDAEAIQFRGFAHYVNDPELTNAIVNGNKKDKTDPHSMHMKVFGPVAKTRNSSKHSMFAIFFGGRAGMISQIMGCTKEEAAEAIQRLLNRYPKLRQMEEEVFPEDAHRGYFIGIDGRKVKIPGLDVGTRKHLCMSGYLQNFEKVVMAEATLDFEPELKHYDSFLVDLVHDEWQTETPNDLGIAVSVAELECKALEKAGRTFNLNCPLAGSYRTDSGKYTFGKNWYETH